MKRNDLRKRGLWTEEDDRKLREYVCSNGGRLWDTVARDLGLGRSGNSCRLRWVNYLSFVRRGKITDEEMLRILTLQSEYGNKWARIARQLPGRTDNDVKNVWYARAKREAKKLNCVAGSKEFLEKFRAGIQAAAGAAEQPLTATVEDALALPPPAATVSAVAHPFTTMADDAYTSELSSPAAAAGSGERLEFLAAVPSFTQSDLDVFMASLGGGSATMRWF